MLVEAARTMLIFSPASLFLWAEAIATACFTQNRSIIHRRFNKTPYELINGRKPDISFLHVFGALCYPKNDHEDIGKLGAKGNIGFFISYSADSCAFRVSGLDLTYAPSTITSQQPTEGELDLLFEAMYDDYIGGQLSTAPRTVPTAQAHQVRQTPTTSTSIADIAPTPTNSSSQATIFPNTSQDVDGLKTQQQHAQQQGNQAPIQPKTVDDNVPNAMFDANTFVNPFATPSISAAESSSLQYNVKEAMNDPAWIVSMQEELLQFKRLDVWVLVPGPDNNKPLTLKWLFKNKHDEEKRPDIVRATYLCARYQAKPTEKHLKKVKMIFRHLLGIVNTGLWYTKDFGFELTGFSNADYAGCKETFKCTSSGAQFLGVVPTKMDLVLEQTQQGTSHKVSVSTERVEQLNRILRIKGEKKEALHTSLGGNQDKPTEKHLREVKRIFCYLRGTVNTGLWYSKDSGFELTGFSDADYAGCKDTFKCTFGGAQFLGEKLDSGFELIGFLDADYVRCKDTFKSTFGGAQFLGEKLLTDYGFHFNKIPIYCDSKSSIPISCNPVQHSRIKHIAVRYHFIKEHVEKGTIELYFVKTDYQLADIFTKALPADRFNYLVRRLGMHSLSPKELERLVKSQ
nr:copia protein [Tanacetum cinerariifolium]